MKNPHMGNFKSLNPLYFCPFIIADCTDDVSQTTFGGVAHKPINGLTVEEVVVLVTSWTNTSKYEVAVRESGLNGATLALTESWEEIRDHCGITFPACQEDF